MQEMTIQIDRDRERRGAERHAEPGGLKTYFAP